MIGTCMRDKSTWNKEGGGRVEDCGLGYGGEVEDGPHFQYAGVEDGVEPGSILCCIPATLPVCGLPMRGTHLDHNSTCLIGLREPFTKGSKTLSFCSKKCTQGLVWIVNSPVSIK